MHPLSNIIFSTLSILLLSSISNAKDSILDYENIFYKNRDYISQGFGIHVDIGYSSYLIELDSSELNSAIDYDVLEFTLGFSYQYDRWIYGLYSKFLINELNSNMCVTTTKKSLNDIAYIDKSEFALYLNRKLIEFQNSSWSINFIYRYSSLDSIDSYHSFHNYRSQFDYQTDGLALSLVYNQTISEKGSWFINGGVLYTLARVKCLEYINNSVQDSFVDDSSHAIGERLSIGYNYQLSDKLFINIRVDGWRLNFNKLSVSSHIGDSLPKAELKERSVSSYGGITWRF